MRRVKKKFLEDFLFGGTVVGIALWLAGIFGPIVGGIFAGLPIRLAATIAIGGSQNGAGFVEKMARGALLGFVANFSFMIVLVLTLRSLGVYYGFLAASIVCVVVVGIMGFFRRYRRMSNGVDMR